MFSSLSNAKNADDDLATLSSKPSTATNLLNNSPSPIIDSPSVPLTSILPPSIDPSTAEKPDLTVNLRNGNISFGDHFSITLHRTLRIPDDGQDYPLPPSLGQFPIHKVDDYLDKVPEKWKQHGGVFFPMYQREAMWMQFSGEKSAVKVCVGKVNAVSGKPYSPELQAPEVNDERESVYDYMVAPAPQPWLDGINNGNGTIRQFVAMPLGSGYTVEAQVTGEDKHGGVQVHIFAPKPGAIPKPVAISRNLKASSSMLECCEDQVYESCASMACESIASLSCDSFSPPPPPCASPSSSAAPPPPPSAAKEMGLAAGGSMKQEIFADPHGLQVWDPENSARCFIHIVNSEMYKQITGIEPPPCPVTAETYTSYGYKWFDYYGEQPTTGASTILSQVKSIGDIDGQKDPSVAIHPGQVVNLSGAH